MAAEAHDKPRSSSIVHRLSRRLHAESAVIKFRAPDAGPLIEDNRPWKDSDHEELLALYDRTLKSLRKQEQQEQHERQSTSHTDQDRGAHA